jgi:signal transduction histidine kinase
VLHRPAEVLAEGGDRVSPDVSLLENDINNPLMTILGMTELLLQERGTYSIDTRQKIQAIKHSAQRIKTTLSRISRHSRWQAAETSSESQ